jgi:hypothetical protein
VSLAEVIPAAEMMRYMIHLGHRRSQKKSERRLRRLFGSDLAIELANDATLDR